MDNSKMHLTGAIVAVAIITMIVLWIIAIIGAMDLTDGCLYRYNFNEDRSISSSSSLMNSVVLKANGNYKAVASSNVDGVELDPDSYGKWLNTNLRLASKQKVDMVIKGEVSLCKAYIPSYNLQQNSNKDRDNRLIEIPRVEDAGSAPINLIFNAKTDEWRNLTQVFRNDRIIVGLHPDKKSSSGRSSVYNNIAKRTESANCTEGKREYNPICGRYSIWDSGSTYVDKCTYDTKCYTCNHRRVCKGWNLAGLICIKGYKNVYDWCGCYQNVNGTAPEPYQNDGKYTSPWANNISDLMTNFNQNCRDNQSYVDGNWQNEKYFWFSADNAAGLLYRFDTNENPSSKKNRGSEYGYSKINSDQSGLDTEGSYRIIRDEIYSSRDVSYLQYRNHDGDSDFDNNTGGYVLNIKQTKCRRQNGNSYNDTFQGRGVVQYIIGDYGTSPNKDISGVSVNNLILDANGSGSITAPDNENGYLWLRINNDPNDYQDSFGQYRADFYTTIDQGGFYHDVLDPFVKGFKGKIQRAAEQIFKNMTCYKGINGAGDCNNFFNYVKGLLSLYIMIYGMMFLVGMVKISQTDLVMRVVKIAFVAGLLNESTFEFFNTYVFDFVTGFTDDIIANMAGYSIFSGSTTISNPFMFLNEVMTKIFLSSTFMAQIMALLSMGLNGIIYFIIIIVCLGIIVIVLLRSIAIYLMAFMAIAVLIGLTPLFLTFILFERTSHLFNNWVKFTFRYMLEPTVLLAGIIILTQLFTIYLDFVIGYSVCWKCALPIKLPFPSIPGVDLAFLDVELFCINWFAPWGFDHRSSQMGLNIQNMVVLLMIVYCMWGYVDFSAAIVARLTAGTGGPSATGMGKSMSNFLGDKALSQVGLDKDSRNNIKAKARQSLHRMKEGDKNNPLDSSGNRHDVKPLSGGSDGENNEGGGSSSGSTTGSGSGAGQKSSASSASSSSSQSGSGGRAWKSGSTPASKAKVGGTKIGAHRSSSALSVQAMKLAGRAGGIDANGAPSNSGVVPKGKSSQTFAPAENAGEPSAVTKKTRILPEKKASAENNNAVDKESKVKRPSLEVSTKKAGKDIEPGDSGKEDGE